MTDRYTHLSDQYRRSAVQNLPSFGNIESLEAKLCEKSCEQPESNVVALVK